MQSARTSCPAVDVNRRIAWYREEAVTFSGLIVISKSCVTNYARYRRQDVAGVLRCSACAWRMLSGRIICLLVCSTCCGAAILSELSIVRIQLL